MATHNGGTAVKNGYYFNASNWEFTMVPEDGDLLPGPAAHTYRKVPLILLLVVAPLLGGLFVMFLPLIGFALAIGHAARKLAEGVRNLGQDVAASMSHDMVPGEAHFAGKSGDEEKEPAKDEKLDALQKEIDEKRAPRS